MEKQDLLNYEEAMQIVIKRTGWTREEVNKRAETKAKKLSGVSPLGILGIIASEVGVSIYA